MNEEMIQRFSVCWNNSACMERGIGKFYKAKMDGVMADGGWNGLLVNPLVEKWMVIERWLM